MIFYGLGPIRLGRQRQWITPSLLPPLLYIDFRQTDKVLKGDEALQILNLPVINAGLTRDFQVRPSPIVLLAGDDSRDQGACISLRLAARPD